jgi:hypothetical protein
MRLRFFRSRRRFSINCSVYELPEHFPRELNQRQAETGELKISIELCDVASFGGWSLCTGHKIYSRFSSQRNRGTSFGNMPTCTSSPLKCSHHTHAY